MSKFKVGDRVFYRGFRRDADVTGVREAFGETVYELRVGHLIGSAPESELSFERCIYIPDLTTAELREWIADVVLVRCQAGDLTLVEGCSWVRDLDPDGHGDNLIDLQGELLAEYASRQK